MKAKSFLKFALSFAITGSLFMTSSCEKDDPKSDLTGITSFKFSNDIIKNYDFTIDESMLTISNVDSLPYGFNPAALVAEFEAIENSTVTVNSNTQESGVTINDFSDKVEYIVKAEDGTTYKAYDVSVNVAKLNPEAVTWNKVVAGFDNTFTTQEYFYVNNTHFIIAGKEGKFSESILYSSADGKNWESMAYQGEVGVDPTAPFPIGSSHNIIVKDGTAYVVGYLELSDPYGLGMPEYYGKDLSPNLYTTNDGLTWNKTDDTFADGWNINASIESPSFILNNTIFSIGGNGLAFGSLKGSKKDGDIYYPAGYYNNSMLSSTDGSTFVLGSPLVGDMPLRTNAASYVYNDEMYIAGGLGANASGNISPLGDVWKSTDGLNWTLVSANAFTPRSGANVVEYDGNLWLFNGSLEDGSCTKEILISSDGGITWSSEIEERQLPDNFTPRCNANATVDSNGNIFIFGGQSTEVVADDDAVGNHVSYTTLSNVWYGKLNKLD